jgi:hypothetical protein
VTDEQLQRLYRETMAGGRSRAASPCPTPDELLALAEGRVPLPRKHVLLEHVASCADCRRDFALLDTVSVARPGLTMRHWVRLAAAAAVVLFAGTALIWRVIGPGGPDTIRGAAGTLVLVPTPATVPASDLTLAWRPMTGATRYHVEVTDRNGAPVLSRATTDTSVALGAGALASATDYRWWVRAERADGTERRSAVGRFRTGDGR